MAIIGHYHTIEARHSQEIERLRREMMNYPAYTHEIDNSNYIRIVDLPSSYGDRIKIIHPYKPNKKLLLL